MYFMEISHGEMSNRTFPFAPALMQTQTKTDTVVNGPNRNSPEFPHMLTE